MKYQPQYTRYVSERKRKAKANYVAKVIGGVVVSLAIASSAFMVMSANDDIGAIIQNLGFYIALVTN